MSDVVDFKIEKKKKKQIYLKLINVERTFQVYKYKRIYTTYNMSFKNMLFIFIFIYLSTQSKLTEKLL
jgi:hypothetical protein